MSIATEPESKLAGLVGHDLVTVITIDRETPWRPRSPLDVPRTPRQVGGMPVRRMPLAELIEHNEEVMRTDGRFWWLCAEMLEQLGHDRDAAGDDRAPSTDAENCGNGREPGPEYFNAETGDGRGDRRRAGSAAGDSTGAAGRRRPGRHISEVAFHLLRRVTVELSNAVFDQAAAIAGARAGTAATIEAEDVRKAAGRLTIAGTRLRVSWDLGDAKMKGGA